MRRPAVEPSSYALFPTPISFIRIMLATIFGSFLTYSSVFFNVHCFRHFCLMQSKWTVLDLFTTCCQQKSREARGHMHVTTATGLAFGRWARTRMCENSRFAEATRRCPGGLNSQFFGVVQGTSIDTDTNV